uniref:Pex N-terminal domain-containing protein n=1 Tax=Onchocerca volvulus TaxID=6282 RepID=A0A8R1XX58_ONCVO
MEVTTRVASLDHHMMNQAIREVAENSFKDWSSKFPLPIAIKLESIQNEVLLIIDTLLWFNRLKSGCNLDESSQWQPVLHFMLSILAPYVQNRLLSSSCHYIRWIHKMVAICRLANFLQLLYFYRKGGYQNLTERITRLKVVPRETLGLLNFETLNRKLIWCSFRDLLVLLIPLRNSFWRTTRYKWYEKQTNLKTISCTRCQQRVVIPVKNVTCGHICCYICFYTEPFCALCGSITKSDCFQFLQLLNQNL